MAAKNKPAAPTQPVEDKTADVAPEPVVSQTMTIKSNDKFTVVDNTTAEKVPPPKGGKPSKRKDKLNGFTVVDYQ